MMVLGLYGADYKVSRWAEITGNEPVHAIIFERKSERGREFVSIIGQTRAVSPTMTVAIETSMSVLRGADM
jgi:hypothetical protein